jgi:hypothetical protein
LKNGNTLDWGREKVMTTQKFQSEVLRRVGELLSNLPKERLRDVVERRFGLKDGNRETLEAIGQDYGITRERVRQIESDAFKVLTDRQTLAALKPIFEYLNQLFEEHNHLMGEERLLSLVTGISESHPARSAVVMVLTLGKPYSRIPEDGRFHPYWITKKQARKQAEKVVDYLIKHFDQQSQAFHSNEILTIISSKYKDLSEKFIENALDISKEISENIFKEMGLSHWPEINPRGVRDKAYLVLKRENESCHFVDITDLINKAGFSPRQAFSQTVHNELIKDERFVLVGRGIYALSEWGYESGIVKEVIAKILSKANKPLTRDEIVSAVLEKRKVKPNTVVINLQNNNEFERLEDGGYRLR